MKLAIVQTSPRCTNNEYEQCWELFSDKGESIKVKKIVNHFEVFISEKTKYYLPDIFGDILYFVEKIVNKECGGNSNVAKKIGYIIHFYIKGIGCASFIPDEYMGKLKLKRMFSKTTHFDEVLSEEHFQFDMNYSFHGFIPGGS